MRRPLFAVALALTLAAVLPAWATTPEANVPVYPTTVTLNGQALPPVPLSAPVNTYEMKVYRASNPTPTLEVQVVGVVGLPMVASAERDTQYVERLHRTAQGEMEVTPNTVKEGYTVTLRVVALQGETAQVTYAVTANALASLRTQGPRGAEVQVPTMAPPLNAEGEISLAVGETQTFALAASPYTATLKRLQ
jgi:hypothetical protein